MSIKWRLCAVVLFLFVLNACKRESVAPPLLPPPSNPTQIITGFSIANVFQSNIVLQRGKPLQIWGTAAAGTIVSVKASWDAATYSNLADASGNWAVTIKAAAANATPQTLTATIPGSLPTPCRCPYRPYVTHLLTRRLLTFKIRRGYQWRLSVLTIGIINC
jgi:hypothetical protein